MPDVERPAAELRSRVTRLMKASDVSWRREARGYTPAQRWVVEMADGRSVFVKAAVDDLTAARLRTEQRVYAALQAPFMPSVLGWEAGERPILALEDLSDADWPPPWDGERVDAVLSTLADIAATSAPEWLPRVADSPVDLNGWQMVADNAGLFLSLGLGGSAWLRSALPELINASEAFTAGGSQLIHFDVRSDNLCLRDRRVLLVDWNLAAVGNARLDIAFWLPSLADEGGPQPDVILPDAGWEAAIVSGFFAARAGREPIPTAPRVRTVQLAQLRQALPWACRALGLPPPL